MRLRTASAALLGAALVASCAQARPEPTTTLPTTSATTTSTLATTSTSTQPSIETLPFDIPKGESGVAYQEDGDPPSGPSSFTILADGSVVIADTMAAARGEPRLLHFDRSGELTNVVDLASEGVASIIDIVSNGFRTAILDVFVAMQRYRVLVLSPEGEVETEVSVPEGFRFEDGLTGLLWDDSGVMLEFELGSRYHRLAASGVEESASLPTFAGAEVEIALGEGRSAVVGIASSTFEIERPSDLGGVVLVGVGPDKSLVVSLDEVDLSGPEIRVFQHVRRYSANGALLDEYVVDVGDQFVEISRPWELDPGGVIVYLSARESGVRVTTEAELSR